MRTTTPTPERRAREKTETKARPFLPRGRAGEQRQGNRKTRVRGLEETVSEGDAAAPGIASAKIQRGEFDAAQMWETKRVNWEKTRRETQKKTETEKHGTAGGRAVAGRRQTNCGYTDWGNEGRTGRKKTAAKTNVKGEQVERKEGKRQRTPETGLALQLFFSCPRAQRRQAEQMAAKK